MSPIPRGAIRRTDSSRGSRGGPAPPRTVGALSAREDSDVPWWRVINLRAASHSARNDHSAVCQRALLMREGVRFAPVGVGR